MRQFLLSAVAGFMLIGPALAQTPTAIGGSSLSSAGLGVTVTAAAAASQVVFSRPANIYSIGITNGATAGFVLGYDAKVLPADGAVTPIVCFAAPASATSTFSYVPGPALRVFAGFVMAFSTGANCFTQTTSSGTAYLWAQGQ